MKQSFKDETDHDTLEGSKQIKTNLTHKYSLGKFFAKQSFFNREKQTQNSMLLLKLVFTENIVI